MRRRINHQHMVNGVTLIDPETTYIDADIEIGEETVIEPNVQIMGNTVIGKKTLITSGSRIENSEIHSHCEIRSSWIESSKMNIMSNVGPYAHLRPGTVLSEKFMWVTLLKSRAQHSVKEQKPVTLLTLVMQQLVKK